MFKRTFALALVLVFAAAFTAGASDDKHKGNQTKCPVMGNPVNMDSYTDYKGYRIFFCCDGCKDSFAENPDSYIEKMKAEGVELMKLKEQSVCPVSGKELASKEVFADYEGKRIYFCCPNCAKAFGSDPEKYLSKLAERGETPEILEESKES